MIQLSNQIFGFIITLILARILSPSDFGIIGLISIFINLSKKITDGGLTSSLIRTQNVSETEFSTIFYFNLVASSFLYGILFLLAPKIAIYFSVPEIQNLIRYSGLTIIISAFTLTQSVKLNKSLNFKLQFKILLPSLIISALAGILSAKFGFGIWSLVIKELAFSISASLQLWLFSKWTPKFVFDWNIFKRHFSFGYKLVVTDIVTQIFNDAYKFIIGKSFSAAQLGFFTRAKSMEELPNQIVFNTINRVLFPMLSQVQDDDIRLKKVYSQIIKMVTFLITPLLMFLYLVAEPLFVFLLTEKWLPSVHYFKVLIIAGMVAPLQPYLLNICKVKGRSDLVLKLSIVEYVIIGLSIFAMIPFGITGLLWGLVAATLAKLLIAMIFVGRLISYSVNEQLLDLKEGFLVSLLGYLSINLILSFVSLKAYPPFFILMLTFIMFYSIVLVTSILFRFESLNYLKSIKVWKRNS